MADEHNTQAILRQIDALSQARGLDVALAEASRYGIESKVVELLNSGANPNARLQGEMTPLMYTNTVSVARILLNAGADINAVDANGRTPLIWFCAGRYPIARARSYLTFLVESGADKHSQDATKKTAKDHLHGKYSESISKLVE